MAVSGWLHTHCSGEMCSQGIQSGGHWQTHWRGSRRFSELGITLWNSSYSDLGVNKGLSALQKKQNSLAFLEVRVTTSQRLWASEALCRALWALFCCSRGPEELHVMREFINTALEWASRPQARAKALFNLDGCLSPRKTKTRRVKLILFDKVSTKSMTVWSLMNAIISGCSLSSFAFSPQTDWPPVAASLCNIIRCGFHCWCLDRAHIHPSKRLTTQMLGPRPRITAADQVAPK